ncbi:hypothetical protein [Thiomicrorhabdus sp.]|uniref:hypothetical protein n=1 Tax=Thiomicrorhabdus sp. TaxID=2039724 RepID=UPI003563FAE9
MGYHYSSKSSRNLSQCHPLIQQVFNRVIEIADCTIITGFRNEQDQNEKYDTGRSEVQWPDSKHNFIPSLAIDAAPYPIDYDDRERITLFAGLVLGIASEMGIQLRWGGDWDRDWQVKDNKFDDLLHFELIGVTNG